TRESVYTGKVDEELSDVMVILHLKPFQLEFRISDLVVGAEVCLEYFDKFGVISEPRRAQRGSGDHFGESRLEPIKSVALEERERVVDLRTVVFERSRPVVEL